MDPKEIRILAEPGINKAFCKVTLLGYSLLPGKVLLCTSKEEAKGSPLLEKLMAISEIESVVVSENVLTLRKQGDTPWRELGKKIGTAIREALGSKTPLFSEAQEKRLLRSFGEERYTDPELGRKVKELIENRINVAVASHGGRIQLVDVKEGVVYIRMEGGCQGCGMANVTLTQGVEALLKQELADVKKVVDLTDHGAGTNPYYPR